MNIFKSAQREHFYIETYKSATTYFQKVRKAVSKLLKESIVEITIQKKEFGEHSISITHQLKRIVDH